MITFIAEVVAFIIILAILARWKPSLPITLPTIRAALAKQQAMDQPAGGGRRRGRAPPG